MAMVKMVQQIKYLQPELITTNTTNLCKGRKRKTSKTSSDLYTQHTCQSMCTQECTHIHTKTQIHTCTHIHNNFKKDVFMEPREMAQ